jgi:hypothetical protein
MGSNLVINNSSPFGYQQPKDLIFMKVNQLMGEEDRANLTDAEVSEFFDKHGVLAPVILNQDGRKQAVLVHINPLTLMAELYYRPNPILDNSNYSTSSYNLTYR